MLSGEGNDGERWKTAIGLISKKTTLHVQHTFFVISLPLFCTTTTRNVQTIFFKEETSYAFSFTFFSLPLIFSFHWWPLAFLILSPPLQNFHPRRCSSNKQWRLCFLSVALDLCRPFSRWVCWPAAYSLFFSVFLLLYIPNLWTWQLV